VNDHPEQQYSHKRRTPEMLGVHGTGARELAGSSQDERHNILPKRRE
jgi:hypothetical protein